MTNSELILNPDGSIYHLNLRPEHIAKTIILVGDPDRVPRVSKYFDDIECQISKREFVTHTGRVGKKRLSVISTGIGTDNIDIVLNELDALVNMDLESRTVKPKLTPLDFIRIGTSGSMNRGLEVDEFLFSEMSVGLDSLLHFYPHRPSSRVVSLREKFSQFIDNHNIKIEPYTSEADRGLVQLLATGQKKGITMTCCGFYGPQGRSIRLEGLFGKEFFEKCEAFEFENLHLTNFEMETSAIFGLSNLLGHKAISCNAILANRITETFSQKPKESVNKLIEYVLEKIVE